MSAKTPDTPKARAVGDEDPDFSPMTELSNSDAPALTRRGPDGRAHKVDELDGKLDRPKKRLPLSEGTLSLTRVRGAPD